MTGTARPFTGKHMAAILVSGFGIVIAVNLLMAHLAGSTFGGVVVENSYVASQHFNRWLDEADREKALGWTATITHKADGRVAASFEGAPAGSRVEAVARHPLGRMPDVALSFAQAPDGSYLSRETLPVGRWTLRLTVDANGHIWRTEEPIS